MAVMLSPLGEALLPKQILARYRAARSLTEQERDILNRSPAQTRELLKNIPQLERVSEYLYLSARGFDGSGFPKDGPRGKDIPMVARIIKLLTDLWHASPEGGPDAAAFEALTINKRKYDPMLLEIAREALMDDIPEGKKKLIAQCHIRSLQPGDVLVDDVLTENSHELVLSRGHPLTPTTIRRLEHFHQTSGVRQPIRVERHPSEEVMTSTA
ncbi:HD domain-containing phosphohydrolase [Roseibium salinum]|nr:HD domain-containing phosphohydrolase [Roseibium salinum]